MVHAMVANLGGVRDMVVNVYDETGLNLGLDRLDADPFGPDMAFHDWEGAPDQTYYIEVLSASERIGTYFLEVTQAMSMAGVASNPGVDEAVAALPAVNDRNDAIGLLGDANFDGSVDTMDFEIWQAHAFSFSGGPAQGDFNVDNVVDASDFHIWLANRFHSSNAIVNGSPASVPTREPRAAAATVAVAVSIPPSDATTAASLSNRVAHDTRSDDRDTRPDSDTEKTPANFASLLRSRVARRLATTQLATSRTSPSLRATAPNTNSRNMEWKDLSTDSAVVPTAALRQLDLAFAGWD
jgi:hypothetical protein